ncbi:MAG: OmpA family protein [Bacteroidetes bacterium]|nr:OmpA family protein [Bacteroidota bacterium]
MIRIGLFLAFCLPILGMAQGTFKGTALPASVNSAYDELVPRLSPDDQTLYFVRHQHPGNQGGRGGGQDIWYTRRDANGTWEPAQNAGALLNNVHHNFVGGVANEGKTLVLGNTYGTTPQEISPGFAFSKFVGGSWSKPLTIESTTNDPIGGRYLDFYCTMDMQWMIVSKLADDGLHEDLYVCHLIKNSVWSEPKSLGSIINTKGFETGPFLSADTKRLFFTSNGHGGQGDADIFMSERLDDSWTNWTDPVNLGTELNTAGFDGHLILDSKEDKAYFVSGPSPTALGDIYEIPVAEIPALRKPAPDTLRIFALAGVPVNLQLDPYGVNTENATFVSTKPIDGPGIVTKENGKPQFVYQPDVNFQGVEHHQFTLCDPPQSDNCRKVILEATVTAPNKPVVQRFELRTPKNKPVDFNYMVDGLSLPETKRNYRLQPGPKGEVVVPEGSNAVFVYRPAKDFVGTDSIPVYGVCPNGETSNCLRAVVKVIVYDEQPVVVAVDTPKVVVVVDTPKVVVVDIPKVVVADTPKVKDVVVSGIVTDEKTGNPLGAELTFFVKGKEVKKVESDPKTGAYSVTLPAGVEYSFEGKQPYYFPVSDLVSTAGKPTITGQLTKNVAMSPIPMEAGQTFVLKNIYFDLDKSILKPESKEELTRLYDLLKNYPTMEIEVRGHTDSQASDDYNQKLSESRAFAVVNYLKYKGVMGYRLGSKGFGEKVPVATNETEEGRALNRRVEFTILKM